MLDGKGVPGNTRISGVGVGVWVGVLVGVGVKVAVAVGVTVHVAVAVGVNVAVAVGVGRFITDAKLHPEIDVVNKILIKIKPGFLIRINNFLIGLSKSI